MISNYLQLFPQKSWTQDQGISGNNYLRDWDFLAVKKMYCFPTEIWDSLRPLFSKAQFKVHLISKTCVLSGEKKTKRNDRKYFDFRLS